MLTHQTSLFRSVVRRSFCSSSSLLLLTRRNFTTTIILNNNQEKTRVRPLTEKDKLKQRQINFEKRLKELDDSAIDLGNNETLNQPPKSFEQRLKELERNATTTKSKVPKWLKEHHTRHPTPYSIYVKQCWKNAIEHYENNKEHFDNLFPNFEKRKNLMISKILALQWKTLKEEDKKIYYDTHEEIKKANPLPIVDDKPEWKKIKRPRTAFLHFKMDIFQSVKSQFASYNIQQLNFIISEMYKKLPEDKLEYYRGLCSKERSQYYKLKEETINKHKKPTEEIKQEDYENEEEDDEYESDEFY
ncbi:predicted protein [Naegleria gruberi]|uniref:Predicted protein n=1 Tax=Naegleria gruberi TaxID=5762 RepID=D2VM44_NAEGR|nr:uncharacterized protein NAEGRDRAFT_50690 [Naegleria gruberi]EFC42164.1 predicted protein [Naegleria gruberi]|eukprot:XP_002674908.1 predicted protein [Naegleria gruberi strain NEG-M]